MKIGAYDIKKRYLLAGVLALIVLAKCTGGNNTPPPPPQIVTPTPAPRQYDDAQQVAAPAAAPVTIVNTPAQGHSDSGLINGLVLGHLLNSGGNNSRDSGPYRTSRTKVINNHYYPAPKPAPTKPKKPGLTTSYNSQPPAQAKYKTWASSSKKGWGTTARTRASGKPAFKARSRRR